MGNEQEREPQPSPIACNLSEPEQRARQATLRDTIFTAARQVRELSDGYALQFTDGADLAAQLLGFIAAERACCPFFTFELLFEPDQGPVWLRLRGPEGTKAFIDEMLSGRGAGPK
ncbi:MAG: hypothetical protein M3Q65_25345 [Chloroflexota bacterium]|nr:hypothetical protein [Chloroflexota bacterium]